MDIELKFTGNAGPIINTDVTWQILDKESKAEITGLVTNQTDDTGFLKMTLDDIHKGKLFSYNTLQNKGTVVLFLPLGTLLKKTINLKVEPKVLEVKSLKNQDRLWLTYETRFNWSRFYKTNQKFQLNLYRIPLPKLLLIFATEEDGLDDNTLKSIRDVFFPHVTNLSDLRKLGKAPWEGQRKRTGQTPISSATINRDRNILYVNYAYMPYNARDNTYESKAIGTTQGSGQFKLPLMPFTPTLEVWNTASRSSLVRVKLKEPLTFNHQDKRALIKNELWTNYGTPDPSRFQFPAQDSKTEINLKTEGDSFYSTLLSVKTGVNIIGIEAQETKAKLEHNSILAALRSSYIRAVENKFKYNSFNDPKILILTEIATVTEADPNWDSWFFSSLEERKKVKQPTFGDGYQIRSLRGMKSDKEYFPPLSIPFVKITDGKVDKQSVSAYTAEGETVTSQSVFSQLDETLWQNFWKAHYAEALGRAKAEILLKYGLQSFGGNSQNYLLEMEDGIPNGRIIFRDMGDYALHDYVLWAKFGPTGELPPKYSEYDNQETLVEKWKNNLDFPLLKFECNELHQFIDSGGKVSEFPTFTGYHRSSDSGMSTFNPFCKRCDNDTKGTAAFVGHISPLWAYALPVSQNAYSKYKTNLTIEDWGKVFKIEMEWGIANVKAWVEHIEKGLNKKFAINWELLNIEDFILTPGYAKSADKSAKADRMYNPAAYTNEKYRNRWEEMYDKMKTWEMYVGSLVEEFLCTTEGQEALRKY